jgi:anti-sigma regulatory factor (Ser/Thr protein kinase)
MRNRPPRLLDRRNSIRPPRAAMEIVPRRQECDLVIEGAELTELRSAVAAWANLNGAGDRGNDVVLVVQELATNVVRHGGGRGRLRLWSEGRRILCRVSDQGPGLTDTQTQPSPRTPGGRGLWIARRLADLRIESSPAGTVVTAGLNL